MKYLGGSEFLTFYPFDSSRLAGLAQGNFKTRPDGRVLKLVALRGIEPRFSG